MKFFLKAILLSVFPIYSFISWIFIFNKYPENNQTNRINKYREMIFSFSYDIKILSVINIILSIVAILFYAKSIKTENVLIKIISVIAVISLTIIFIYNIWGLF